MICVSVLRVPMFLFKIDNFFCFFRLYARTHRDIIYLFAKIQGYKNPKEEFPTPQEIVNYLIAKNKTVPRYLLPPKHLEHIPPHVVAFDLIRRNKKLKSKLSKLERYEAEKHSNLDFELIELRKLLSYARAESTNQTLRMFLRNCGSHNLT